MGLKGSGDNSEMTKRALANILRGEDLKLTANDINSKSVASVMVTAQLPAFARVGTKIDVTVSVGSPQNPRRPAWVHLWAVDEGILLTTAYKTPDPMKYFFAKRRLGVATSDMFARLLPDHRRPKSMARIGAGSDEDFAEVDSLRRYIGGKT